MQLTSSLFSHQSEIPAEYTCKGRNTSPALTITGTPPGAKSLALIMHDPDAPSGDFTHWVMWNISADATDIPGDTLPAGAVQGGNDFGAVGYGGPCPPSGTHRYIFELYALDTLLALPQGVSRQAVEARLAGHVLEQAQLIGLCTA